MTLFIPPPSAGNPIWANDHIWLDIQKGGPQKTDEAEGTPPPVNNPGSPTGTLDNVIGVTVDRQDHGTTQTRVWVQAFVSNPSVGVGASPGNLASAGGLPGLQDSLPIGTSFATDPLPAIHIDWYPLAAEVATNGGHICIAANVYDEGGGDGTRLVNGPIILSDPHTAQRNIHIVLAPAGRRAPRSLPFSFYVPEAELMPTGGKEILLRAEPVPEERVLTSVIREQLIASNTVILVGGKPTPQADVPGVCLTEPRERIRLRGGGELVLAKSEAPVHPGKRPAPEVVLGGQERPEGPKAALQVVPQPGRLLPVTAQFVVTAERDPGSVYEFDIICEGGGGEVVGGLRIVLLTDGG